MPTVEISDYKKGGNLRLALVRLGHHCKKSLKVTMAFDRILGVWKKTGLFNLTIMNAFDMVFTV